MNPPLRQSSHLLTRRRAAWRVGSALAAALSLAASAPQTIALASPDGTPPESVTAHPRGIVGISVSPASGVTSAWLGNGVRLHHLQMSHTDDRARARRGSVDEPRVIITAALAGGELHECDATRGLSAAATNAWRVPATRTMGIKEMGAYLRERRIHVVGYAAGDAMVLRVDAPPGELEAALRLTVSLLTEPVVDPAPLAAWADATAERVEQPPAQARWIISGALREVLLPAGEARFRPITPGDLRRITAADAQKWLDRHLAGPPAPMEVSIVGEVGAAEALRHAESALGELAARERISPAVLAPLRAAPAPRGPAAARISRPIPCGKAGAGAGFFGTDRLDLTAHRALSLAAQILDERVTIRIRERGWGGMDDVVTTAIPGGFNPGESGVVLPAAMVHPRHADAAADLIAATIAEFAARGPTPDEFRRAKATMLGDMGATLAGAHYWSAVLARSTYRGYTPDDLAAAIQTVEGLTMDDVTAAVRSHAAPGRSIRLIIEPSEQEP